MNTPSAHSPELISREALQQALSELFAPWVQALELRVDAVAPASVSVVLPVGEHLARVGGTLCGQAMMAAADTAMVLALMAHFGAFRPCTTVQMNTSFLRPLVGQPARVTATVIRAGKSLAFGEIDICGASDGKSVCRASVTYALL